jgi:hypothetical protein
MLRPAVALRYGGQPSLARALASEASLVDYSARSLRWPADKRMRVELRRLACQP